MMRNSLEGRSMICRNRDCMHLNSYTSPFPAPIIAWMFHYLPSYHRLINIAPIGLANPRHDHHDQWILEWFAVLRCIKAYIHDWSIAFRHWFGSYGSGRVPVQETCYESYAHNNNHIESLLRVQWNVSHMLYINTYTITYKIINIIIYMVK